MDMLYEELSQLTSTQDKSTKEKEMEQATTELKRALDAIQKALQRKESVIQESQETSKDEVPHNMATIGLLRVSESMHGSCVMSHPEYSLGVLSLLSTMEKSHMAERREHSAAPSFRILYAI